MTARKATKAMAILVSVDPTWQHARDVWLNLSALGEAAPTMAVADFSLSLPSDISERCRVAPVIASDDGGGGAVAAALGASVSDACVLESDGESSRGLSLSLTLRGSPAVPVAVFAPVNAPPLSEVSASAASSRACTRTPLPRLHAIELSPDGDGVVIGSADARAVVCWLRASCEPRSVALAGHIADVTAVRWFPSGKVVLTGGSDMRLRVFDARSGACAAMLIGHSGGIAGLAIIERGRHVLSVARDFTLRLWSIADRAQVASLTLSATPNGVCLLDLNCSATGAVHTAASVPASASGGSDSSKLAPPTFSAPAAFAGKFAAVPSDDGCVHLIDVSTMRCAGRVPLLGGGAGEDDNILPCYACSFPAAVAAAPEPHHGSRVAYRSDDSAVAAETTPAVSAAAAVSSEEEREAATPAVALAAPSVCKATAVSVTTVDGVGGSSLRAPPTPHMCSFDSGARALCASFLAAPVPPAGCSVMASTLAVGGTDGYVALWSVSAPAASVPQADAASAGDREPLDRTPLLPALSLFWRGRLLCTGAEVLSMQLLDVPREDGVGVGVGCARGTVHLLAGLSDGTSGIFVLRPDAAAPVGCPVVLSGPVAEPVRAVSASLASSEAAAAGLLTVATACNDGSYRIYQLPRDVLARFLC